MGMDFKTLGFNLEQQAVFPFSFWGINFACQECMNNVWKLGVNRGERVKIGENQGNFRDGINILGRLEGRPPAGVLITICQDSANSAGACRKGNQWVFPSISHTTYFHTGHGGGAGRTAEGRGRIRGSRDPRAPAHRTAADVWPTGAAEGRQGPGADGE